MLKVDKMLGKLFTLKISNSFQICQVGRVYSPTSVLKIDLTISRLFSLPISSQTNSSCDYSMAYLASSIDYFSGKLKGQFWRTCTTQDIVMYSSYHSILILVSESLVFCGTLDERLTLLLKYFFKSSGGMLLAINLQRRI